VGEGEVGCVMKKVTLGGHAANYSEGMLDWGLTVGRPHEDKVKVKVN
jgi:hypothetical protein